MWAVVFQRVLLEALRGLLQVLVDAERRRVLDRRVVDLDAGPVVAEDVGAAGAAGREAGSGAFMESSAINGLRCGPGSVQPLQRGTAIHASTDVAVRQQSYIRYET